MIQKLKQKDVVDSIIKQIETNYKITPKDDYRRNIEKAIWFASKGQNKLTYRLSVDNSFMDISKKYVEDHTCYWIQDDNDLEYKCKICGDYYHGSNIYKELEDQDKPKNSKLYSPTECNIELNYYEQRSVEARDHYKMENYRTVYDQKMNPVVDYTEYYEIDESYIEIKPIEHNIVRKKQVITKVKPKQKTKNTTSKNQIKVSSAQCAKKDAKFSVENSTSSDSLKPNYEAKELQSLVSEVFETETDDSELVDIDDICDHSDLIHISAENIKACLNCGKEFPL